MSGVYANLIENWLTNVNELGYQIPFCEVLLTRGYKVLYVSSHGPGEHGKDVLARDPEGKVWAFQLKGGPIRLSEWRRMQDEVRELVELPVSFPGISSKTVFQPVLVTNGHITPDARDNIRAYAEKWSERGASMLEVWSKHHLLSMFVEAHGSYLPTRVDDFRRLTELYSLDPGDRIPRDKLLRLLIHLVQRDKVGRKASQKKRALESMVLIGSYIVGQYESEKNYASAVEGWTIVASAVLHFAARDKLANKAYSSSLSLIRRAYESNLHQLEREALDMPNWVQGAVILAEPQILPARVTLLMGWLGAAVLERSLSPGSPTDEQCAAVLERETPNFKMLGEIDFARLLTVVLLAEILGRPDLAKAYLISWIVALVRENSGDKPSGVPTPYWDDEKVIRYLNGMLPNYEEESFGRESFTLLSALDMAVRRNWRHEVATVWPAASKITFNDFVPDGADWFTWRAERGNLHAIRWPQPVSWSQWRSEQASLADELPELLTRHSEWALPLALTIPHRLSRGLTAMIDARFNPRDRVV